MRLFWKLFLALWLSIMGFVVVNAVFNLYLHRQNVPDPPRMAVDRSLGKAERIVAESLQRGGAPAARQALDGLPRTVRRHLYLFDQDGRELLGRDRIRRPVAHGRVRHSAIALTDREGSRYRLLVLRVAPPGRWLEPGLRGIVHRLLLAAVISALVSAFLAHYLARPLASLGRASRRLAAGDLGTRVGAPLTGRGDEFGVLARDFDDMAMQLERLQAASNRLLRDVSHELRSPLARLRVALEIARNRDGQPVGAELDRIELEGERLEYLIDQVLDLLRESSGAVPLRLERFDLSELLSDLVDVVAYEVPEGAPEIRLEVPGPLTVKADRELLWRAFENLLRNALRHTGERGGVSVATARDGRDVEVRVADDGPGVPADALERIFDPFYRVQEARDRQSGGHGLGLAIAAAALRRHDGRIEARNRAPAGLEIVATLPLAD